MFHKVSNERVPAPTDLIHNGQPAVPQPSAPLAPAVEVDRVSKFFGQYAAVNDLSLTVPRGSIYGVIGPNGSGKTTTLRMILSIILPDSGRISVLGKPTSNASRDQIGYLPEERGLYKKMQVRRLLRYYGQLKGRSVAELDPIINRWLGRLQLSAWADKTVDQLSKGMAQKIQFIAAVVAEPQLLILDEPFSGLDPVNAESLREAVLDLRREGRTILFSTHDMGTAERMCDRICMIFRGRKVLDGSLDEIQEKYERDVIRVRLAGGAAALSGIAGIQSFSDHGNFQDLRVTDPPQQVLARLMACTEVRHFEVKRPSLGDVFIEIARPVDADLAATPAP
jgi:ABC-2 type transport system ATP-binding protein